MTKWGKRRCLLGCVFSFSIFIGIGLAFFGSLDSTFAWLNGESVYIYPKRVDLGNHQSGTKLIVTFKMKNLTNRDISVVGEKSSCTCAFSDQIPITAKPGEVIKINVNVNISTKESVYEQTVIFMVAEAERLSFHPVQILARVKDSLSPGKSM